MKGERRPGQTMRLTTLLLFIGTVTPALSMADHASSPLSSTSNSFRDPVLYGTLNYVRTRTDNQNPVALAISQHDPYKPPATIVELFHALIRATRDWFSDLILRILGITSAELIKQINAGLLALEDLLESAVLQLRKIADEVSGESQTTLHIIIDCILKGTLQLLEPVQEQLSQVLLYLPETIRDARSPETRDIVSDIIEALLGISLEQLLTNINNLFLFLNQCLLETMTLLHEIADEVPPEVSAEIDAVISQILFEAHYELLRPLLNSLGQLPMDKSAEPEYLKYSIRSFNNHKYFKNTRANCASSS